MDLQHFVAKIHVDGPLAIDPAKIVDVFHGWVAKQSVPGVVLIDVAELLHIPNGPGVIAVGVEADYALDHTGGTWGILARRKNIVPGTNAERIALALREAARTGENLRQTFPALQLSRTTFELIVNDRAIAPNTSGTYAAALPEIAAALTDILGTRDFELTRHDAEPRQRFGVTVVTAQPFDLAALAGDLAPV